MTQNPSSIKLFGTDGIRGKANHFPVLPEIILKVGQALGFILNKNLKKNKKRKTVLIGKDTRLSGYMLEQALASGLNSMGIWVQLTGPLPTPGIGFLAQNMRVDAGVVISASHNLYQDNGVKIFGPDGLKISPQMEEEIERLVFSDELKSTLSEVGRTRRIDDASGRYVVFVKNTFPKKFNLEKFRIALDCSNGAGYKVAPAIFEELGAEVITIGDQPDGYNINSHCGAVCHENIQKAVIQHKSDVGISLDGDADRVIMVDELGEVVNGDHILGILALHLKKTHKIKQVVSTKLANMGLENFLNENDIELVRVDIGDKHVIQKMQSSNILLGGEPSGHIIFSRHSLTGDGCIAALSVLAVMISENKKLSELRKKIKDIPQVIHHVSIKKKTQLNSLPGYLDLTQQIQKKLNSKGRFYVRFSGTEPVARVMVEGENTVAILDCAKKISHFLKSHLN